MRLPNHSALEVQEGKRTPATPAESDYLLYTQEKPVVDDNVAYAADIYTNDYKSEVLEAFLLTKATPAQIMKVLRVPEDVVKIYQVLFFDMTTFRDELDIIAYAETYEEKFGREIKVSAVNLGYDYLAYKFGGSNAELDIAVALRSMIENAYILSKAVKLNQLDSNIAREARQWLQAGVKAMEAYVRVKPIAENTDTEFRVALKTIERVTNEVKDDEIVH